MKAIVARVTALTLPSDPPVDPPVTAFQRVGLFDSERLTEAFKYLLVSEQRVCVVVPLHEEFSSVANHLKLISTRMLPVMILCSDRVLGDRTAALWGSDTEIGAQALMELVLPEVTGVLLPAPNKVLCEPVSDSILVVMDTEKALPGRVAVGLEVKCTGGSIEATLGKGPVF